MKSHQEIKAHLLQINGEIRDLQQKIEDGKGDHHDREELTELQGRWHALVWVLEERKGENSGTKDA